MLDKEDLSRTLLRNFNSAAKWRQCQASKFPEDNNRNSKAAERLLKLASDISIPDMAWASIAPYFNEADSKWLRVLSDTNRDIGFRKYPLNFADYLANLVVNLQRH
jgi:hypothetical protein